MLMEIAITSGTPLEFFKQARDFGSRKGRIQADDPVSLGEDWGLPPRVWHEEWSQASGGEAQRALLAIAVALKPDILLLDEPTSYQPHSPLFVSRLTVVGLWMRWVFK
jgi:ATPase subunit of ABC transporter with duplicated ATPase domains